MRSSCVNKRTRSRVRADWSFFFCGYSLAGVWKLVPQGCLVLCEFYVFSRRVCTYFVSNFGGSLIMISDFNLLFVLDENGRIQ